jgi:hypothetical protein
MELMKMLRINSFSQRERPRSPTQESHCCILEALLNLHLGFGVGTYPRLLISLMIRKEKIVQMAEAAESPQNESDPSSSDSPTNFTPHVYSQRSELYDAKENLLPIPTPHSLAQSFSVGTYTRG